MNEGDDTRINNRNVVLNFGEQAPSEEETKAKTAEVWTPNSASAGHTTPQQQHMSAQKPDNHGSKMSDF